MRLDLQPDLDIQLDIQPDEEPQAPRSRWKKDDTKSPLMQGLAEEGEKAAKKHKLWPLYQQYLQDLKAGEGELVSPKPGEIPFTPYRKGKAEPMSFSQFKREHGVIGAGIANAVIGGIDTARVLAGGVVDALTLPIGAAKGVLDGRGMAAGADEWMRSPLAVPKTDLSESAMQWMGENVPAFIPHIPVRASRRQILRNLQEEARKAGMLDIQPEAPATAAAAPQGPVPAPDVAIDMQGSQAPQYIPGDARMRVDENGIPYRPDVSEGLVPRTGDLFGDTPPIADYPRAPEPTRPTMRVTPEGQAFPDSPDLGFWQDRAAALTREEQDQLAFYRQQALIRQREAQMAEEARGQVPLRGQTTDPFNPYPVVGDTPTMEAMARAQGDVAYGQLPPDAVVPRDAPTRGMTMPRGQEWVVDENGMPVRQRMPEMVVDPNPMTLTDKPAIDALGNAIQDANGPILGPDQPFGSERLAGPMGAPALSPLGDVGKALADQQSAARSGIGPGRAGPGRGISRGAINLPEVKKALEDLRKGIIKGPDALRAFVGTFDPMSDHSDISKGIGGGHIGWMPAIQASRSMKSEGRLVWMSPDEFHDAALPRHMDSTKKNGIGERKRQSIRIGIKEEAGLTSVPVLRVVDGRIVGHEGRHRMDVMRELGVKKAPVYMHTTGHTNGDGPMPYRFLVSEDGSQNLKVPDTIFPMGNEPLWAPTPVGQAGIGRGTLQRGGVDLGISEQLRKGLQDIENISKTIQTFKIPSSEEIVQRAKAAGKDSVGMDMFEAGATLTGLKRNSPLIQAVGHVTQWYKAAAERNIRDFVFPYEAAVRKLSASEAGDFATLLKREMFAGTEMSVKALADAGYSEKTLVAYQKAREMFNQAWAEQNRRLVAAGKKPLTKLEAYLNSQWQGNHRRMILDKNGRPRWFLAADSAGRLERDTKALLKDFPDLVPQKSFIATQVSDNPFISTRSKSGTDMAQIYRTMIEIMGDDPAFQQVKAWYEQRVGEEASHALGQERFFKDKAKVRGFVGDRPLTGLRSTKSEALALLQAQANYAKDAFKWSALQDAADHLKPIFSDKDLAAQQPNNMRYSKEYFMNQLGGNEYTWIKGMEDWIDKNLTFTSTNQIGRGVNTVKAVWTVQKLGFNLGYAVANLFQLPQALPYLAKIQMEHGGNPVFALGSGATVGSMMVMQHQLNPAKVNLAKMFAGFPEDTRRFYAEAMKYAEDNGVVLSSAADEAPIARSFGPLAKAKRVADWTISFPDSLRSIAFMTFASHLKSTGKFDHATIFQKAHDMTVASMVDFREGEKAMVFNKMGVAGQAANTLQSYAINYFQQWNMWTREALNGNPVPALVALGVQGAIGGAMGLPLFASVDKGLEWMKDWLKESFPLVWNKVKDFSLKEALLKSGGERAPGLGEYLLYGAASKNDANVSIASRVQAPAPEEMLGVPFAPALDFGRMAANLGKTAMSPSAQNLAQNAYDLAPSGLQGLLETGPLQDFVSVPREDNRVVARPRNMSDSTGIFERTPEEANIRKWGMRAQSEVFKRDEGYKAQKRAMDAADVVRDLPKKIWNASRAGDKEKLADYIKLYAELAPGLKSKQDLDKAIGAMLNNQVRRTYTTGPERLVVPEKSVQSAIAFKRFKEAMERAGYGNQSGSSAERP